MKDGASSISVTRFRGSTVFLCAVGMFFASLQCTKNKRRKRRETDILCGNGVNEKA